MHEDLLIKMLEVQKNMRHDLMNHIQVIYGFLQIGNSEKAKDYAINAVESLRRYSKLGKISLPLLQSFLTWFVSCLNYEYDNFECIISSELKEWREEDGELTRILQELLCSVKESIITKELKCSLGFTDRDKGINLSFAGKAEIINRLRERNPASRKLSVLVEEPKPGEIIFLINRSSVQ